MGYHRNPSLYMEVNLCKSLEIPPPITRMMSQIRTRYKAPGTSSSTRYPFLVDTTRIISGFRLGVSFGCVLCLLVKLSRCAVPRHQRHIFLRYLCSCILSFVVALTFCIGATYSDHPSTAKYTMVYCTWYPRRT